MEQSPFRIAIWKCSMSMKLQYEVYTTTIARHSLPQVRSLWQLSRSPTKDAMNSPQPKEWETAICMCNRSFPHRGSKARTGLEARNLTKKVALQCSVATCRSVVTTPCSSHSFQVMSLESRPCVDTVCGKLLPHGCFKLVSLWEFVSQLPYIRHGGKKKVHFQTLRVFSVFYMGNYVWPRKDKSFFFSPGAQKHDTIAT